MKNYRMNNLGFITEIKDTPPLSAYELADELDWTDNAEAAAMLRMQADEIKALRKQLISACNELMEVKR